MIRAYRTVHAQFIHIPKNASTSILAAMYGLEDETVEDVHTIMKPQIEDWDPKGPPTFCVIRHPWHRFVSTWRNKVYNPHRPDTTLLKSCKGVERDMSLTAFAAAFLRHGDQWFFETHIRSQVSYLPEDHRKIEMIAHEDLTHHWKRLGYAALWGELPVKNRSYAGQMEFSSLRGEVENKYRKDLNLWKKVIQR